MSNTIKPQELRIGNYFKYLHSKEYLTVSTINSTGVTCHECMDHFYFKEIEPIPLTEEILVKCGFELEVKESPTGSFRVYTKEYFTYNTAHCHFWISKSYGWFKEPEYLHQLQNLFYSLTGRELEI